MQLINPEFKSEHEDIDIALLESFASQKKDGMGLGLSITRSIIERHYGNLYLSSTSKKGSIFIINLPLEMNKI